MNVIAHRPVGGLPRAVALLVCAVVAPTRAHAVTPSEVRSLRGLTGVEVVVERLDQEIEGLGLSADQLRAAVRSRLQEGGVAVLTAENRPPGRPWLYVRVYALKSASAPLVSFFVSFQLRQDVTLDRNPDAHMGATTWDLGATGLAGLTAAASAMQELTQDLAARFVGDFLAANPKR